ncbi:MAG: diguanylate cyclase [Phycisphaerales bacterium]|nr:diguanylate cyclase [Phycisphaerales bacterium]
MGMLRASENILLIGDGQRELLAALNQAMPQARITEVATVFDGIAELAAHSYSAVLASAEPIERRPEAAIKTLRQMAGEGRLLLFGHPTLEPLSRKMLQFGCDDYLLTPINPAELQQIFGQPPLRLANDTTTDEPAGAASDDLLPVTPPARLAKLATLPLAETLLDALLHHPADALATAVQQINSFINPPMRLSLLPSHAPPDQPEEGMVSLSHDVRANNEPAGTLRFLMPRDEDESTARHFLGQLAHLLGKAASLQERHGRLQKLAITDDLTGLYNGRYFKHFLTRILEKAKVLRFPVTLLLFDIDNFKQYNDQYGHGVGDEILRQTAALMRRCVRDHDLVARISGDEFAVVFWEKDGPRQPQGPNPGTPGRPPQTPLQIFDRFQKLIAGQNFTFLGPAGQGTLTISAGLAVFPYDASNPCDLINAADKALMFGAKQAGKNSIMLVGGTPPDNQLPQE